MQDFLADLRELEETGSAAIDAATAVDDLERLRVEYLGRKAPLTQLLRSVGQLPHEQRRAAGAEANRVKGRLQELLDTRLAQLAATPARAEAHLDLTLPARERWRGALHPCTLVADEICGIFKELGFVLARGP
jgi:phenylalanyl-tRNA synthetase alpha chain